MTITSLETFRPAFQPNLCVVRLTTDDGLVGLGESFFQAPAVESYLHTSVAPIIVGSEHIAPEETSRLLMPYVGFQGGGVESRGNGAVDIALWDLLGKRANLPISRLLGGPVRSSVRIYNTCAGSGYVGSSSRQESANWGIGTARPYEDLDAFLQRPAELAAELAAEGITAMKIWPFDTAAERTNGNEISREELRAGLEIVEKIRGVSSEIDIMIELHGLWNLPAARTIVSALEPYSLYWVEDPLRSDASDALRELRASVNVPIASGETAVGRRAFLPLLREGAIDFATMDVQWTGGLTEARKVASLADTFAVPIAPHDCTGPFTLAACAHLTMSQPNGVIQETTRSFLRTWYEEVAEGMPRIVDGAMYLSERPGLGVSLAEGFDTRNDVVHRVTDLATVGKAGGLRAIPRTDEAAPRGLPAAR
jgi:L-alanine-DL-glutamate epimerase-like enolase superfamily enzyme